MTKASSWWSSVAGSIGAFYSKWFGGGGGGLFGGLSGALGSLGSSITSGLSSVGSSITSAVGSAGASLSGSLGTSLSSLGSSVTNGITDAVNSATNSITDAVNSAVEKATGAVTNAFTAVTAATGELQGKVNDALSGPLGKISQIQAQGGVQHIENQWQLAYKAIPGGWGMMGWVNELVTVDHTAKLNGLINESGEGLKKIASYEGGAGTLTDLTSNIDGLQTTLNKIKDLPDAQKAKVLPYVDVPALETKLQGLKDQAGKVSTAVAKAEEAAAKVSSGTGG